MDLDGLLVHFKLSSQKFHDLSSLVSLELKNVSEFLILVDVAVAAKILLQSLKNSLKVIFARNALDRGDGLAAVTLLTSDMNVTCRMSIVVTSIGEGICWGLVTVAFT